MLVVATGKFFEISSDLTFWQLMNSQFLATLVGAVVAMLVAFYGKKTADAADASAAAQGASSAAQQAQQVEAQSNEEVEEPEAAPGEADFRDCSRELIASVKQYLDGKANGDPDGRHRRTYEAINRYDYMVIAVALNVREQLTAVQLAAAAKLFARWKHFERGKAAKKNVPKELFDTLRQEYQTLTGTEWPAG